MEVQHTARRGSRARRHKRHSPAAAPGSSGRLAGTRSGSRSARGRPLSCGSRAASRECRGLSVEQLEDLYQDTAVVLLGRTFQNEAHLRNALRWGIKHRALHMHRDRRRREEILIEHAPRDPARRGAPPARARPRGRRRARRRPDHRQRVPDRARRARAADLLAHRRGAALPLDRPHPRSLGQRGAQSRPLVRAKARTLPDPLRLRAAVRLPRPNHHRHQARPTGEPQSSRNAPTHTCTAAPRAAPSTTPTH